jgi:hypothetical protein
MRDETACCVGICQHPHPVRFSVAQVEGTL